MLKTFTYPRYAFRRPQELGASGPVRRHPVVVVGAGPVGLCAAIDLALQGQPVLLLDDDDTVSLGSRGLCWAQRTLQVFDRLGVGQAVVDKGVTWNTGRTFHREHEVFRFELQPEAGHERPGMVNLQQYHVEKILVERALQLPLLDLRFKSRVEQVVPRGDGVDLQLSTPEGEYRLQADWLIVADGARSPIRRQLGLDIDGQVFRDRFLIADVLMRDGSFPAERWFWFDPPFHPGQSVLLHREADDVWRIDFQLGWQADPEEEKKPERVMPRIRAMLGPGREFELEWVSVYTFQCRRMARLRHGRIVFMGDAAHQVSPFGARGANSGVQDVDNLVWKLKAVLDGRAPECLLDSVDAERLEAADENIAHSTRATDFITPKSAASLNYRNAVLALAREHPFARTLVNSGRLSVPTHHAASPLSTPDAAAFGAATAPGSPVPDAPLQHDGQTEWLLRHLGGRFVLLVVEPVASDLAALPGVETLPLSLEPRPGVLCDAQGLVQARLGLKPGGAALIRPDQLLAARWQQPTPALVQAALRRALGHEGAPC